MLNPRDELRAQGAELERREQEILAPEREIARIDEEVEAWHRGVDTYSEQED